VLGDRALDDIGTSEVLDVLRPIWGTKHETARKVRFRLEYLFDEARHKRLMTRDNPSRMNDLKRPLARITVNGNRNHHKALPWRDVPALMKRLRQDHDLSSYALRLTILSALRTSESLGGRFDEFDNGAWSIPRNRMKTRKPHRVPITTGIAEIVNELLPLRRGALLFPSNRSTVPLSVMSMPMKLRGLGYDCTVHGFRSSFRDFAAENNFPREIAEAALAHVVPGVEGAYFRSDVFDQRRDLMQAWSDFCLGVTSAEVTKRRHTSKHP